MVAGTPFYYGWLVVAAAMLAMFMTLPGQTAGIAVFLEEIIVSLDMERTTVSLLYLLGTLAAAMFLTVIGWGLDRFGPRPTIVVVAVLLVAGCLVMSVSRGPLTLLLGLILVRAFGQGGLPLVSIHTVNLWFIRRRGLAVGLAGLGVALGTVAFPPFIEVLMANLGWRNAYAVLGGLTLLVVVPLGWLFFRDRPELYGLLPDNGLPSGGKTVDRGEQPEPVFSLPQAQRTLTFWLFVLGGVAVAALGTGLVFHHYGIMSVNGVDRTVAALMFVSFGLAMAASNFVTGLALDRFPPRYLLSLNLLLLVAGLISATFIDGPVLVVAYGVCIGMMQGMHAALHSAVYSHYFGRAHHGVVRGFATTLFVGGTAAGPYIFALGFDLLGDYSVTLAGAAIFPLLIALAAPFVREMRRS